MRKFLSKIKRSSMVEDEDDAGEEYLELNTDTEQSRQQKVSIRPYVLNDFSDVKPILDRLRENYTIALINIKPLKEKDLIELKRAINKLKKTTEAIEGDIAGFGDDYIVVAPSFAEIHRTSGSMKLEEE
ncbi:MAG: cell division protein SepF [Nanoarchaeota archaeon]|nr:cell division protein SepF [Nanoarchaeota archaeon]